MENQKVRDLSTAQSPKATDFVMLITNLTNNVLEKCQVSTLRELLLPSNISDDVNNILKIGSDDKLYVPIKKITPDYERGILFNRFGQPNFNSYTAPNDGIVILTLGLGALSTQFYTVLVNNKFVGTLKTSSQQNTIETFAHNIIVAKGDVITIGGIPNYSSFSGYFYPFKGVN